jgi:Domain of unknown function (DUF6249)
VFCPECGTEERHSNQFCRACGIDLRRLRSAIETPDSVTASAMSARDEIGRAVAAKIRETQDAHELKKVVEDVLPEIEKFLESPAEKKLRSMRMGAMLSSIGIGIAIALSIVAAATQKEEILLLAGLGFINFFIGLGFIINGMFLTVPKKSVLDKSSDAEGQRQLDGISGQTNDLRPAAPSTQFSSVTESTTRHLHEKQRVPLD